MYLSTCTYIGLTYKNSNGLPFIFGYSKVRPTKNQSSADGICCNYANYHALLGRMLVRHSNWYLCLFIILTTNGCVLGHLSLHLLHPLSQFPVSVCVLSQQSGQSSRQRLHRRVDSLCLLFHRLLRLRCVLVQQVVFHQNFTTLQVGRYRFQVL